MKKLFRIPIYLGIILVLAGLIGCSNPYDLPEEIAPLSEERAADGGVTAVVIPIGSAEDLAKIGIDPKYPLDGHYELTAHITLKDCVPIGDETAPFSGVLNGKTYSITLVNFDAEALAGKSYLGIFGYVAGDSGTDKAALKNISVIAAIINEVSTATAGQAVGLLAGYTENAEINDITLSGAFNFTSPSTIYLGGVVGYAQTGTVIEDSSTAVTMLIDGGGGGSLVTFMNYNTVGGIVGLFKDGPDIIHCQNTGNVSAICTAQGAQVFCGGIAGGSFYYYTTDYQGSIQDCSSTGNITARCLGFWSWAGGIAGCIVGGGDGKDPDTVTRIVRSYATGTVSVADSGAGWPYVGGIVAYNYYGALVSQCWFYGDVISNTDGNYTGGIAGYNSQYGDWNSTIEDCWSGGTVTGFNNAGGIVGQNQAYTYVRRCYSTATVICLDTCDTSKVSTNPGVGGIAGYNGSNMSDAITACVALNEEVHAKDGKNIHRVAGLDAAGTLNNNLGWIEMPIDTDTESYVPDIGPDRPDGADCDYRPEQEVYVKLGWDFGTSTSDPVWKWNAVSSLPELQWQ